LTTDALNNHRAAPLNCARVCFQTVLSSAVTCNSIPKLGMAQDIDEVLLAESLTVASVGGGGLATRWEPLAAFFLNAAIDHQDIPTVKKPDAIKEAPR
jgi:hypothetical protein